MNSKWRSNVMSWLRGEVWTSCILGSLQSARQRGVRGTVRGVRGMRGTKNKKNFKKYIYKYKKIYKISKNVEIVWLVGFF